MRKVFLLWVGLFLGSLAFGQKERVYVGLDKYNCLVGDTVWCKGYVMQGDYLSYLSTNIYLQLYNESGVLVMHRMFPVFNGYMAGQFVVPDSFATGTYYLAAFTRQQFNYDSANLFTVPVIVFNKDKQHVAVHKKRVQQDIPVIQGDAKDLHWITTFHHDSLCLYLRADTVERDRHFLCQKVLSNDSAITVAFTLRPSHEDRYILFPLDSAKEREEFFLYEDSVLIGRQSVRLRAEALPVALLCDTVDHEKDGYNAWRVRLTDSTILYPIISVSDADRTSEAPLSIALLNESYTDNYGKKEVELDTAFLSFRGKATRSSGKLFKDFMYQQLSVTGAKDTVILFSKAIDLDAGGNFNLSSLVFFGDMALNFQVNNNYSSDNKDVRLHFSMPRMLRPDSTIFRAQWEDGDALGKVDTVLQGDELVKYEHSKIRTLAPAVVKHWKRPGDELNHAYTTGPFAESSVYEYDLRNYTSDYNRDLLSYINALGNRVYYDPVADSLKDRLGHPVHIFVDQLEYDQSNLGMVKSFDFDRLAYIKILESDFLSTRRPSIVKVPSMVPDMLSKSPSSLVIPPGLTQPTAINVCIYTRKGNDYRTMRGGMNKVMIEGYNEVLPSFMHDRATLYWNVWQSGQEQHIRFSNANGAKRFRVRVEGVTRKGRIVCMEKIIG